MVQLYMFKHNYITNVTCKYYQCLNVIHVITCVLLMLEHACIYWQCLVIHSSTVLPQAGATNYTCRSPVGVAGLISPWNLPLYLLTFKIAPALAAGCTVVCKPSEMTSLTAHMLAKIMNEVGECMVVIHMMVHT